ncbi:hypothetical protein DKP78_25940, partial [Enterococcus faecium]
STPSVPGSFSLSAFAKAVSELCQRVIAAWYSGEGATVSVAGETMRGSACATALVATAQARQKAGSEKAAFIEGMAIE